MKIGVIVSSTQLGGGAEQSSILLANGLSAAHEVDLITYYEVASSYKNIQTNHVYFRIPYRTTVIGKIWNIFFRIPYALKQHMKHASYDLFIVNGADSILSWGWSGCGKQTPWIAVLRNHPASMPHEAWSLYLRQVNQATHIVAISAGLVDLHGLPADQVTVIPNPIDVVRYQKSSEGEDDVTHTTKNLLFVGRLEPIKQPLLALDIFYALYKKDANYRLTIVGDGSLFSQAQRRIQDLGLQDVVAAVGSTQNIVPYLHAADALLLTSQAETFGRVLVEAMAAGLPVIATNCPVGPSEILGDTIYTVKDTYDIIYAPYGLLLGEDISANVDAIHKFLTNKKQVMYYQQQSLYRAKTYTTTSILERWQDLLTLLVHP